MINSARVQTAEVRLIRSAGGTTLWDTQQAGDTYWPVCRSAVVGGHEREDRAVQRCGLFHG